MNPKLVALLRKGHAYQVQGNLAAAEKNYLRVLKYDVNNAIALNLLGVVCIMKREHGEATRYLLKALKINSADAETHFNLGLAYIGLSQFAKAQNAFEDSLRINRNQPLAWYNLANVMAAVGRQERAISCYESALALDPNSIDCLNNLAVALKVVGRLEHALQVIELAIKIDGTRSILFDNKGLILLKAARYEPAREAFERAVELGGGIVSRVNLSTALKYIGEEQAAVEVLNSVLKEDQENAEAHCQLGILHVQMGNTGLAVQHFRQALERAPGHTSSLYELSKLKDQRLTDEEIAGIHSSLERAQQPDSNKAWLCFALAFEYEKRGEFDAGFDFLLKGQKIMAARHPYDPAARLDYLKVSQQVFPVELPGGGSVSSGHPVPVFIVGMPRSGTTLVEQIVSSHSAITGAGEVGFLHDLAEQTWAMTREKFPISMTRLKAEQVQQLRETYLKRMVERFGNNRFIVDKNPLNFNLVGLIGSVFPEARILWCRRDPLDNCVSIFRLPFDEEHAYSHDLSALGHYYCQHAKLMDFWKACYPDQILTVRYEEIVADLETQARRMLGFIGVEFEDRVLSFFENERIVLTPSADQVRRPVYGDRVHVWERYRNRLGPLIESLRDVT